MNPHLQSLTLAVVLAVSVAGCGKRTSDDASKSKAAASSQNSVAALRIELKNAVLANPKSADARYRLGQQFLADGEAAQAVIELQRALDYKHPEGLVAPALAEALNFTGQAQKTLDTFSDTKLANPAEMAHLQAMLGQAMAMKGDLVAARKFVDLALKAAHESAPALLMKARLLASTNEVAVSLATLDSLVAAHPDDAEAWALKGDLMLLDPNGQGAAITAYLNALKAKPDHVHAHSALIAQHLVRNDLEAARKQLADMKRLAPRQLNTALLEAYLAEAHGNFDKAREIHQALLKELPENVTVLISAGNNELKLNAPVQAESLLAKASALAPANLSARRLLAEAQIKLGQPAKALITMAPLVENPDATVDVLALAAQARVMNGEAKEADSIFARLAKLKPTDPRQRTMVATAGFGRREESEVFSDLRKISSDDKGTSADIALVGAYRNRGQVDQALEALLGLERKRPKDPMVHLVRGQLLAQKNNLIGARESFEKSLAVDPGYFPAVAALSVLDLRDEKPEIARKRFMDLIKAHPNHPRALQALAELSVQLGDPKAEVLKRLNAAVKAAPGNPDVRASLVNHLLKSGELEAALVAAQTAVAALPQSVEMLDVLARCQLRAKQTNQALASYGKITGLDPKSAHPYLSITDVHLATNNLEAAQRNVERAIELSPDSTEAWSRAATIALRRQQPAEALSIARRLQAKPLTQVNGWAIEGQIEISRKNWDAAAAALGKAVDKGGPTRAALMLHMALESGGKADEAKAVASKWLKAHPRDMDFLFYLGDQMHRNNDAAASEQLYRQVLSIDPDHPQTLNNLAMLLMEQKKPGATALAKRAVALAPDQSTMFDTLAQTYASDKEFAKAIDAQKRSLALASDNSLLRLSLAKLYLQAGDKAQAKAELTKLASLGPKFSQQADVAQLLGTLTSALPGR